MKRHPIDRPFGPDVVYTALQEDCPHCGHKLPIYQNDGRRVQGLDFAFWLRRRDKRCSRKGCPGPRPIIYAPRDLRVVLPNRVYGLEVTLAVGERHLLDGVALARITRDLNARGVPIDQRHTGRVFRDFLALAELARGDDQALVDRLRAQGGITLMADGVQFDGRSPVLYLVWDAISGQPLFGERKPYRGEDDLVPLFERVKAMDVPIIGVVTDKENGLVPAVERVFPGVPYQFCQTHFLKNCAKPLKDDTKALGNSVRRRADEVRKIGKRLRVPAAGEKLVPAVEQQGEAPPTADAEAGVGRETETREETTEPVDPVSIGNQEACHVGEVEDAASAAPRPAADAACQSPDSQTDSPATTEMTEEELAREICELVRVNSRVSGKAPLDPPELRRHERLREIRSLVMVAREKGGSAGGSLPTSGSSSIS